MKEDEAIQHIRWCFMLYLFPGISLHFVAKETYIITILSKFLHCNLKNK